MATITKKELVDRIAATSQCHRLEVRRVIQCFLDEVIDEMGKGNRLEFRDFGVFEIKERAARVAQNPKTLERVQVPAKRTVKFKVGRLMKDRLDEWAKGHKQPGNAGPGKKVAEGGAGGAGGGRKPEIVVQPDVGANGRVAAKKQAPAG